MSLKKLAFNAPLRSTKVVDVYQREKVFTNDKETVELNFTVTDMAAEDLTTATAEVLLYMKDGSFFQVTDVTKTDNVFTYVMSDTQGKHPGLAKTQLVVTIGTKKYASQLFEFFVNAGLDGIVATEVMIQDWTTLTAEARTFIDQAELDEAERISNEEARVLAENQRINDFSSKADKTYADAELLKKVDKVTGKGLSTNDFDNTYKQKIDVDIPAQLAEKVNSVNGVLPDVNGNVEIEASGGNGLVASYAHTSNLEVIVTSVDIATSTFTANGHGLANDDKVIPFANLNVLAPLKQYLVGNMNVGGNRGGFYRIMNVTADTFQIGDGTTPLVLSTRATQDLSKWHFERVINPFSGITGLNGKKYRALIKGQISGECNSYWLSLSANGSSSFASTTFLNGFGTNNVFMYITADLTFDSKTILSVNGGFRCQAQLDSTADATIINRAFIEMLQKSQANTVDTNITSIILTLATGLYVANGFIMEVYEV